MIKNLSIKNFKSHKDTNLSLGEVTVLCGQNGVGKSTIIQSLLLLRQTYLKGRLNEGLEINGDLCQIGSSADALYFKPEIEELEIEIGLTGGALKWSFKAGNGKDNFLYSKDFQGREELLETCGLFRKQDFQYISASRSPMEFYPKKDYEVTENRQVSLTNGNGELVAHFLDYYGNEKIQCKELINKATIYDDLLAQTVAWEREISSGVNIHIGHIGKYYEINYSFDISNSNRSPTFKGNNVGFGIGYTLPLIVSILSSKQGSVLLLENPEAHLHPHGQAKITELICLAAKSNIQVLVETHSDHVLNGVLVAIKKGIISPEQAKVYYVSRDEKNLMSQITEVVIVKGGKIANQPKGFFDQMQMDLKTLMGF